MSDTGETPNAACEKLQEKYDALHREYAEYVYITSHDFQAPLRNIKGFSSLLERKWAEKLDEESLKHLNFILKGVDNAQSMLDALLVFSRLETRANPFSETPLQALTEEAIASLSEEIQASDRTVTIDTPLPTLHVDPQQIQQLIHELLANSLKFRRDGITPDIHISAEEHPEHWQFSITDNGKGINPVVEEQIYTLLRPLKGKKDPEGLGMGLAYCRKIVQRHEGKLWHDSPTENAATFHWTLAKGLTPEG